MGMGEKREFWSLGIGKEAFEIHWDEWIWRGLDRGIDVEL